MNAPRIPTIDARRATGTRIELFGAARVLRGNAEVRLRVKKTVALSPAWRSRAEMVELAPAVDCDAARFVEALDAKDREGALALSKGPLLDGFDLAESEELDG